MKPWIGFNAAMTQDGRRQIDGAVAILLDGKIHSLAQERLTRRKHDGGVMEALRHILDRCGLRLDDVGRFVVSTAGEPVPEFGSPVYLRPDGRLSLQDLGVDDNRIHWRRSHHESHAYEAIFAARNIGTLVLPALVFVADRVGQTGEHQSYFLFDGNTLKLLGRDPVRVGNLRGLGETYDRVTRHLGWRENLDAGKTMALAGLACGIVPIPHGRPMFFSYQAGSIVSLLPHDEASCQTLLSEYCPYSPVPALRLDSGAVLTSRLQAEMELAVYSALSVWINATHPRILLCGGGLATNCRLLGHLASRFAKITVQGSIAPGDTGQGIGNLVAAYFDEAGSLPGETDPFGGFWPLPKRPWEESMQAFQIKGTHRYVLPIICPEMDVERAAQRLMNGDILAVMEDRVEPGPRALGFHSLLADARDPDMRQILNRLVKNRESFRPFGAIMTPHDFDNFFGRPPISPFMDLALPVSPLFKHLFPSIVHTDDSTRIQVLSSMHEGSFVARLLNHLEAEYGVGVLINTSLNSAQEPIIHDAEALKLFLGVL